MKNQENYFVFITEVASIILHSVECMCHCEEERNWSN